VILRCTKKLLAVVGPSLVAEPAPAPNGEDWYANLLGFNRRKWLLLTHPATLFSIFGADVGAADLRAAGPLVTRLIRRELRSEGLPPSTFADLDPDRVILAKTADRSVLGCMNDMAFLCERGSADPAACRAPISPRSTGRSGATSTAPAATGPRSSSPLRASTLNGEEHTQRYPDSADVIALVNAAAALHASPDLLAGHDDAPELPDRRVPVGTAVGRRAADVRSSPRPPGSRRHLLAGDVVVQWAVVVRGVGCLPSAGSRRRMRWPLLPGRRSEMSGQSGAPEPKDVTRLVAERLNAGDAARWRPCTNRRRCWPSPPTGR